MFSVAAMSSRDARADTNAPFAVGVGTSAGVQRTQDFRGDSNVRFGASFQMRLQFVRHFGLELGFAPAQGHDGATSLVFDHQFQVSPYIYLIRLEHFGFYLKAGIGAANIADLVRFSGETTSYSAGLGFDVFVTEHIAIGAEWQMVVPGTRSIENTITTMAETSVASGVVPEEPSLGEFVGPQNFRAEGTVTYYF